jgi:1-deoxy-D-xylulose-5-phosphate reductoisomerase
MMRRLTILGATGTIGVNTLDVVSMYPNRFEIFALTGMNQIERLAEQCIRFRPRHAVVIGPDKADALAELLQAAKCKTEVLWGMKAMETVSAAPEVDTVMAAIVGAAGLKPALAAARAGKRILLANKETLVMAGQLFMDAVHRGGAELLPIDSEHNAVFQCLPPDFRDGLSKFGVRRILLTASGGPFRSTPLDALRQVTPEQAVAHPNWVMGRKISVDSATMMNKGLEVIEAHWLFDAEPDRIEVVIHPQSIVHSMVEYLDGSVLAQLSNPDMRTPIAFALDYPERIEAGISWLDFSKTSTLSFEVPDARRFPCLNLAYAALRAGDTAPAVLNAANEVAVAAFLDHRISYPAIHTVIERTLENGVDMHIGGLDDLIETDAHARKRAREIIDAMQ